MSYDDVSDIDTFLRCPTRASCATRTSICPERSVSTDWNHCCICMYSCCDARPPNCCVCACARGRVRPCSTANIRAPSRVPRVGQPSSMAVRHMRHWRTRHQRQEERHQPAERLRSQAAGLRQPSCCTRQEERRQLGVRRRHLQPSCCMLERHLEVRRRSPERRREERRQLAERRRHLQPSSCMHRGHLQEARRQLAERRRHLQLSSCMHRGHLQEARRDSHRVVAGRTLLVWTVEVGRASEGMRRAAAAAPRRVRSP